MSEHQTVKKDVKAENKWAGASLTCTEPWYTAHMSTTMGVATCNIYYILHTYILGPSCCNACSPVYMFGNANLCIVTQHGVTLALI